MKLFNLFKKKRTDKIESSMWNILSDSGDVQSILKKSKERPQLIYKHSSRCSVSFIAKDELDSNVEKLGQIVDLYIIDVIRQRNISNAIATVFKIRHESLQAVLIKDGNVVWKASHWDVNSQEILSQLNQ